MKNKKISKRRNSFIKKLRPTAKVSPTVTSQSWVEGKLVDDKVVAS